MFQTISKILIISSFFSVILVYPGLVFPFIVFKYVFFRFIIGAALIAFLMALLSDVQPYWERLKNPIVWAVSGFVGWLGVTTLTAYDPKQAFWSNFERGEGFLQILSLYAMFLIAVLLFDKKDFIRALWTNVVVMALVILYGIISATPYALIPTPLTARFFGSLGNPIYFGAYSLFIFGFIAYLWGESKVWQKWLLGSLGSIYFVFFWLAQARAAFFGLLAGVAVVGTYILFKRFGKKSLLFGAGVFLLFLMILGNFSQTIQDKKLGLLRVFSFDISSSSVSTRVFTWGAAIQGLVERPFFGWGLENFSYVFDKYYDSRHIFAAANAETWYDRAHNVYLDYAVAGGLPALVLYIGMFTTAFWQMYKTRFHPALMFVFTGYLIQGLAGFDVLSIYIPLFFTLAITSYETN